MKAERLTISLLTVGETTTDEVRRRSRETVERLGCRYDEVVNVTPLWRAMQTQAERCETEWYLQQDADVLLEPGAVERLWARAGNEEEKLDAVYGWLWDDVADRAVLALRMTRADVVRRIPFRDVPGPDSDQHARMVEASCRIAYVDEATTRDGCVGVHVVGTPERAFRHWRDLVMKQRVEGRRDWIEAVIPRLRVEARTDPIREAAWLGAVVGTLAPLETLHEDAAQSTGWTAIERYLR